MSATETERAGAGIAEGSGRDAAASPVGSRLPASSFVHPPGGYSQRMTDRTGAEAEPAGVVDAGRAAEDEGGAGAAGVRAADARAAGARPAGEIDVATRPAVAGARRRIAPSPGWRFGLATIAATALLVATYGALVLTTRGQRLENLGLMGAQLRGAAAREESLAYLSQFTVLSIALAVVAIAAIAFARRRPGLGVLVGTVIGGATVVAELLKDVLPRPALVEGPVWILRNDFPSGTATVAAALGIGALLVAPDRLRWLVLPVGAVFAAVIGQSTQITGWHRMSSAIGGVLLVIAAFSASILLLERVGLAQPTASGRIHPRLRAALLVLAAAAFVGAAAALVLLVAFPLLQVPADADSVFFHTVFELVGFGLTIVAFLVFATIIEPFTFGRSAPRAPSVAPGGEPVGPAPIDPE
jgi:hypothetical protein